MHRCWLRLLIFFFVVAFGCDSIDQNAEEATWALTGFFKRQDVNPILSGDTTSFTCPVAHAKVKWSIQGVKNVTAVVRNKVVYMLFEARDPDGTSRLGISISADGVKFSSPIGPLLFPNEDEMNPLEWPGGLRNPRVTRTEAGNYHLLYVASNNSRSVLSTASSSDFLNWTKNGPAFTDDMDSISSAALVVRQDGENLTVEKIDGKYWMYFSKGSLFAATSEDMIHWTPIRDKGELKPILTPSSEQFDDAALECGPYGLITNNGIVLIYNGISKTNHVSGGQILLDKTNPGTLLHRLEDGMQMDDQDASITGLIYHGGSLKLYYNGINGVSLAMR